MSAPILSVLPLDPWLAVVLLLGSVNLWVGLPTIADAWAWVASRVRRRRQDEPAAPESLPTLLFLIPAHNEELLIGRTLQSLSGMSYPRDRRLLVVVADNCTDDTALVARRHGAVVLERSTPADPGKSHAIEWALQRLQESGWDAVVIVDADTVVEPDFAAQIGGRSGLRDRVLQTFDGMSNEFESWLTRLAGLLTRNRYGVALPLKRAGGLAVPVTGNGTIIGADVLQRHPWRIETVTEGWELYAKYTLAGQDVEYLPAARLYAQEAKSLRQSRTQRERWSSGRFAVFRLYWRRILTAGHLSVLQRLDLLAELTNPGPVFRGLVGLASGAALVVLDGPLGAAAAALGFSAVAQPLLYSALSLRTHPEPISTLAALVHLPRYALWRTGVAIRALFLPGRKDWVRTGRHLENETSSGQRR